MVRPGGALRLRPLEPGDEAAFRDAHEVMALEGFTFGLGFEPEEPFSDYVEQLAGYRCGIGLPERWVPSTFLVADVGGEVVGRSSIRHVLNDFLAYEGGHIGYGVRPEHRRRGYASEILRQSLVVARSLGVDRALITCDETNTASVRVIEGCGGVLETTVDGEKGDRVRRYWIA
jgi:predicted acetyltransferase